MTQTERGGATPANPHLAWKNEFPHHLMNLAAHPSYVKVLAAFENSPDILTVSERFIAQSQRKVEIFGAGIDQVKQALNNNLPSLIISNHPSGISLFAIGAALKTGFAANQRMAVLSSSINRGFHPVLDEEASFVSPLRRNLGVRNVLYRPHVLFTSKRGNREETKKENHTNLLQFATRVFTNQLGIIFPDGHKVGKKGIGLGIIAHYLARNLGSDINLIGTRISGFSTARVMAEDWLGVCGLRLKKTVSVHFEKVVLFSQIEPEIIPSPQIKISPSRYNYLPEEIEYFSRLSNCLALQVVNSSA